MNASNLSFECCICKYIHILYCSAYKISACPLSSQCPGVTSSEQNKNAYVASAVHWYLHAALVCGADEKIWLDGSEQNSQLCSIPMDFDELVNCASQEHF